MKKIITLAVFALATIFATEANAQVKFGVKGGLNITQMKLDKSVTDKDNQTGFFFGPTVKFSLPLVGLGIDAAALYDQRSADVELKGKTSELKQQQIVVPVNVRYSVGLGDMANIFGFTGPQFGFNVGSKDKKVFDEMGDWKLKTSNLSWNIGVGATLIKHLQVSANYNIALGKTGEVKANDAASTVIQDAFGKSKAKYNAWQLSVAYFF